MSPCPLSVLNWDPDAFFCVFLCIPGIGASKNCQDLTFCGTGPVSEPETKAVASFIEKKKEDIVCFLTIHSYGQLILLPYGYTKNKASNHEELVRPERQSLSRSLHRTLAFFSLISISKILAPAPLLFSLLFLIFFLLIFTPCQMPAGKVSGQMLLSLH